MDPPLRCNADRLSVSWTKLMHYLPTTGHAGSRFVLVRSQFKKNHHELLL